MGTGQLDQAMRLVEEANRNLDAERCTRVEAARLLALYSRIERLVTYGKAAIAVRLGDAQELARVSGTSVGAARRAIDTGRRMAESPHLAEAARSGSVSMDQAEVIARTAEVAPESVESLVSVARSESFQVLQDTARTLRLEAEDRATLGERQHAARRLRHWVGEMGMIHIDAALEPHVGVPIVSRLEAEARRIARSNGNGGTEPFERHLADALPRITNGEEGSRRGRTEMVVLVSHEITQRGWSDVRAGEHCKIPGIGPIDPEVAKGIAQDAFLNALFFDGSDLRHFRRWTRNIPPPIRVALQLGEPPEFDGHRCIDCGRRYDLEIDHLQALADGGSTSVANTGGRCPSCHKKKTAQDTRERRRRAAQRRCRPVTPRDAAASQTLPLPP